MTATLYVISFAGPYIFLLVLLNNNVLIGKTQFMHFIIITNYSIKRNSFEETTLEKFQSHFIENYNKRKVHFFSSNCLQELISNKRCIEQISCFDINFL